MFSSLGRRWRLSCRLRKKHQPAKFRPDDLLYRDFAVDELDDDGNLDVNTLRIPDMSCNWGRFSKPRDILYRPRGSLTNGCYSLTVATVRFKVFATACHDPICGERPQNYSHIEVRELYEGESVTSEPEKGRKKRRKALRGEWKTNIINNLNTRIEAQKT